MSFGKKILISREEVKQLKLMVSLWMFSEHALCCTIRVMDRLDDGLFTTFTKLKHTVQRNFTLIKTNGYVEVLT